MKRSKVVGALLVAGLTVGSVGEAWATNGPMGFTPIAGSAYGQGSATWEQPFVVPEGFRQELLIDETTFDIYPGVDDLTDMNTVNETGQHAGRYLYRTHEVGASGSVSVVDLQTGEAKVLVQDPGYRRLDGLVWTPWGTLLFAEETTGGRLFEVFLDPADPTRAARVETRLDLGVLRHEGIDVAPDGSVYVIDELNGGSIFRFVPNAARDLSSGQLYALKLKDLADPLQAWNPATIGQKVGAFDWVALDMNVARVDAKAAADLVNATEFGRPEDVEIIKNVLYVANTTEDRVVAIDLKRNVLTPFVWAGANIAAENIGAGVTGFNAPDNLANGPDGRLWIVEDNDYSDIWVAQTENNGVATAVELFASLKDVGGEGSGIYFGNDPHTLFVNVQHPDKALADGTWMITNRN